jgi:hypothetical protein
MEWVFYFIAFCMGTLVHPLSDWLIKLVDKWMSKR